MILTGFCSRSLRKIDIRQDTDFGSNHAVLMWIFTVAMLPYLVIHKTESVEEVLSNLFFFQNLPETAGLSHRIASSNSLGTLEMFSKATSGLQGRAFARKADSFIHPKQRF